MRRTWLSILLLLASGTAGASIRPTAWSYGVDIGEQGESGGELWLGDSIGDLNHAHDSTFWSTWLGATTTLTDHLELAAYGIAGQSDTGPISFARAEVQARVKILDWLGVLVAPVLTSNYKGGGLAVLTLQSPRVSGFTFIGNAGAAFNYDYRGSDLEIPVSAGASYALTDVVKLNVEGFFRAVPGGDDGSNITAEIGPGIALEKGHFWSTINVAFGSEDGTLAANSRLIMGLMF